MAHVHFLIEIPVSAGFLVGGLSNPRGLPHNNWFPAPLSLLIVVGSLSSLWTVASPKSLPYIVGCLGPHHGSSLLVIAGHNLQTVSSEACYPLLNRMYIPTNEYSRLMKMALGECSKQNKTKKYSQSTCATKSPLDSSLCSVRD